MARIITLKTKKISAVIGAVFIIAVSGCAVPGYHYDVRRDLSITFGNADSVIEEIREAFRARCPKITVCYESGSDNMDDIYPLIDELVMFAMSETGDPCMGDYLYHQYGGYRTEYSYEKNGDRFSYTIDIFPEYFTTPNQEKTVDERISEIVAELDVGGKSEYEKISAVYNYVYENVKYDKVHKKNPHYHLKSTAYGALTNGCACCQGYSVLMYRLLREVDIDARVITGNAVRGNDSGYHAWNIASLDGVYYNIDVTWDSHSGTHDNFLKSDKEFSETHIRDEQYSTAEFYERYPMSESNYIYRGEKQ